MASRKALVAAINSYPNPANFLPSCLNDARGFEQVLRDVYSFTEVKSLYDAEATLDNVSRGLDWLFQDATGDDRLVFYFSGHGFVVKEGNDVQEVVCLYDKFLFDRTLSGKSQALPPGVFTMVSDSCHSGGLNKDFSEAAVTSGAPKFLQAPPREYLIADGPPLSAAAGQLKYRPFGAPMVGEMAANKKFGIATKGIDAGGQLEMNGLLMSACLATETASASTQQTKGLSAFTFALLEEIAREGRAASSNALLDGAKTRLKALGFRQTPLVLEPPKPPALGSKSFLEFGRAKDGPAMNSNMNSVVSDIVTMINNTKVKTMASTKDFSVTNGVAQGQDKFLSLIGMLASIAVPAIIDAVRKGDYEPQKSFTSPDAQDKFWRELGDVVVRVLPDVVRALSKSGIASHKDFNASDEKSWAALGHVMGCCMPPLMLQVQRAGLQPQKDFEGGDKFWGAIASVLASALPSVISALSKDGASLGKDFQVEAGQEKFFGVLLSILPSIIPVVVRALSKGGFEPQKDFASGDDKGFWSSVISVVGRLGPIVLQALTQSKGFVEKDFDDKSFWDALGDTIRTTLPMVIRELTKGDSQPVKAFDTAGTDAGTDDPKFWGAIARVVAAAIPAIVGELTKSGSTGKGLLPRPEYFPASGSMSIPASMIPQIISNTMPAAKSAWH